MKKAVFVIMLLFVALSVQDLYSAGNDVLTHEEMQFLEQMKQKGVSEDEIDEMEWMLKAKHEEDKQLSEEEKNELDQLLRSKWNGMRQALEQGDVDTAVSFYSKKSREHRRKSLLKKTSEQLREMSQKLCDIKLIEVYGNHEAEYDIRIVRDGKTYSYMLRFEKNRDGIWEIEAF